MEIDKREEEYQKEIIRQRMEQMKQAKNRQLFLRKYLKFIMIGIVFVAVVAIVGVGGSRLFQAKESKSENAIDVAVLEVEAKTPDESDKASVQPIKDEEDAQKVATTYAGWQNDENGYWYQKADGSFYVSGWQEIDGVQYYFQKDGYRATGWLEIDGEDYYFGEDGHYDETAKRPMVALTFDDGPGQYTGRLLDCLEENNAKATFFMLGQNVEKYPEYVSRQKELGMEIGNHSYNHPSLIKIDLEDAKKQIDSTNTAISNIIGEGATLMRPPYGDYNSEVLSMIDVPAILWDLDTLDWKTKDTQNIIDTTLNNVADGSIILMHDIHETTVAAVETIIPELIKQGYKLVTVSELAEEREITLEAHQTYSNLK